MMVAVVAAGPGESSPITRPTDKANRKSEPRRGARKPYQKPDFRSEPVFESNALACGKTSPTQSQCRFNRKNS